MEVVFGVVNVKQVVDYMTIRSYTHINIPPHDYMRIHSYSRLTFTGGMLNVKHGAVLGER